MRIFAAILCLALISCQWNPFAPAKPIPNSNPATTQATADTIGHIVKLDDILAHASTELRLPTVYLDSQTQPAATQAAAAIHRAADDIAFAQAQAVQAQASAKAAGEAAQRAIIERVQVEGQRDAALQAGANEKARADKWESTYKTAWLGGRAWLCIWWIIGIGAVVLIADGILSAYTGGALNPLAYVIPAVVKCFKWLAAGLAGLIVGGIAKLFPPAPGVKP